MARLVEDRAGGLGWLCRALGEGTHLQAEHVDEAGGEMKAGVFGWRAALPRDPRRQLKIIRGK